MNPQEIPDEIIAEQFHDRGLWDDTDLFTMFPIESIIEQLEERGYTVCRPSE